MDISKELAVKILKYLDSHPNFYFPFLVMNKEYTEEDNDFVEIEPSEWSMIRDEDAYETFQLWENLQDLRNGTTELLSRGFINVITQKSLEDSIQRLVKNYKKVWKGDLWESGDSAEYGFHEYLGGKIEAYEDCLRMIRKFD